MTDSTKTIATLPKEVFGVDVTNHELLKLAYDSYLANNRLASATTLQRGEVRGGGKKPWKQKGTGRARFGSSRNPIWRGGGIVFGPTGQENYTKKISTTSKRVALRQALSLASNNNKLVVIEKLVSKEGKTAELAKLMSKLGTTRAALLVVTDKTPELVRASKNLGEVKLVNADYLNVYDIMNAHSIVMTTDALKSVEAWLTDSANATTAKGGTN